MEPEQDYQLPARRVQHTLKQQQPVVQIVRPGPNPGTAVVLEILPGLMIQTFGIGNIYAGRVGTGIALMLTYWGLTILNLILCFVVIGFITWPLTWILYMIFAPMSANSAAKMRQLRGY